MTKKYPLVPFLCVMIFLSSCSMYQKTYQSILPAEHISRIPKEDSLFIKKNGFGAVVFYAISMIGIPYVWGGINPKYGFDCSGFVNYIYRKSVRVGLPRTAQQIYRKGYRVLFLRPGDLVFFHTNNHAFISHVGIYVGNNSFVHSPRSGQQVRMEYIRQPYWEKRFMGAKRILGHKKLG